MKVQFSADSAPKTDGGFVTRSGKIFEPGNYPEKKFALSAMDMDKACADFKPVSLSVYGEKPTAKLNVGHRPSIFDLGEFGQVTRVWNDGKEMFADVKLDKDIDAYLKKNNIVATVSAEWDIPSKSLMGLALEHNPYFHDAAIYAAFSKDPAEFARNAVASMHDSAVYNGAECGGKSLFSEAAKFMTTDELKTLQKVHDMCTGDGKHCDAMASRNAMYSANDADPMAQPRAGKGKPVKLTDKIKALFQKAGVPKEEIDAAFSEQGETPAAFSEADAASVRAETEAKLRAEFNAEMAKRDTEIANLKADFAGNSAKTTFAANKEAITQLKRDLKITAAEGEKYLKMAEENPAAFAANLPILKERTPLAQFNGPKQRLAPVAGSPTAAFNAKVEEYAKANKVSFGQAAKAVAASEPELAQAHFAATSIAVGGASEGDN